MTYFPPVVGIDPSLTAAGIAHAAGTRVIGEKGKAGATLEQRRGRLLRSSTSIALAVAEAAAGHAGALVVVESPAYDSRTGSQHDRSGLWWLLVEELMSAGHLVVEVTGGQRAKYAVGKGTAGKTAVASAATHRYGVPFVDDNEADAFVLRAMALDWLGCPLATVPKVHRAALDAVAWPAPERVAALELNLGPRRRGEISAAELLGHLPAVAAERSAQLVHVPGQLELEPDAVA